MQKIVNEDSDYFINIKGMKLLVKSGVFKPDPKITHSTFIAINNLPDIKDKDILDLGCGTGAIGIYCALNGARKVICSDVLDIAIVNCKENIKINNVMNKVKVIKSDLFEKIYGKFDSIIGNLPIDEKSWNLGISTNELIRKFIMDSKKFIKKNGKVYFTWYSEEDDSGFLGLIEFLKNNINNININYKIIQEKIDNRIWYFFELNFK